MLSIWLKNPTSAIPNPLPSKSKPAPTGGVPAEKPPNNRSATVPIRDRASNRSNSRWQRKPPSGGANANTPATRPFATAPTKNSGASNAPFSHPRSRTGFQPVLCKRGFPSRGGGGEHRHPGGCLRQPPFRAFASLKSAFHHRRGKQGLTFHQVPNRSPLLSIVTAHQVQVPVGRHQVPVRFPSPVRFPPAERPGQLTGLLPPQPGQR